MLNRICSIFNGGQAKAKGGGKCPPPPVKENPGYITQLACGLRWTCLDDKISQSVSQMWSLDVLIRSFAL